MTPLGNLEAMKKCLQILPNSSNVGQGKVRCVRQHMSGDRPLLYARASRNLAKVDRPNRFELHSKLHQDNTWKRLACVDEWSVNILWGSFVPKLDAFQNYCLFVLA